MDVFNLILVLLLFVMKIMKLLLVLLHLLINLIIKTDQRKLPGYLKFAHVNGETYEPEINNIAEEFIFYHVNE